MATSTAASVAVLHPLDPLTADEIRSAVAVVRASDRLGPQVLFIRVCLHEPPKRTVLTFQTGDALERQAFVLLRDRLARTTCEVIVSVTRRTILSWKDLAGVQPPITFDEFLECERMVQSDPTWQAAMKKRGVTDFSLAMVDPWSAGYYGPADDPARRLVRALTWIRTDEHDNGYARPIEGLVTLVDLDRMEVAEVEDHAVVPLPTHDGNYTAGALANPRNIPHVPAGPRADLRRLEITQPEGPSFQLSGYELTWQKWRLRIGFTPREGLVLHTVGYQDRGRVRPILYRAALAEMVVPYGDPAATHWRKNAFDEGEYGMGALANRLELGCDCLGEIRYLDGVVSDTRGEPVTLENAICLHEEDFGILWKHTNVRTGQVEVRRSRRFVISSIATVGNYEYGFFWYLYQDGTIELQIKMTGIVSTGAIAPGAEPEHGVLIAPGLYAPHHQHWFNFRLDMMVDGLENSVHEVNSEAVPLGPANPHGNAWVTKRTLLARESAAQRLVDPLAGRYWVVSNPGVTNSLGQPVGYKLVPGENVGTFAHPGSSIARRASFMTRHLWVTRYDPAELFAAGDYPNQHPGGAGLPAYVAADRSLERANVVLWYSVGSHHISRPEEWPVMPVGYAGFQLKPAGFFVGSPALDVPATSHNGRDGGHCH
ncbi:MAG TPA: primary-amine oxidase [Verrucomicrobiae bacterium]|jgi:primary-amine oxidase|nr:primary-amine oxidase [Verrucomicrobiae bacterium]